MHSWPMQVNRARGGRTDGHLKDPTCTQRLHSRWSWASCTCLSSSSRLGKGWAPPRSHTTQASAVRRCSSWMRRELVRPPRCHLQPGRGGAGRVGMQPGLQALGSAPQPPLCHSA